MDSTNCATDNDKTVQILTLKFGIDTNVIFIPSFHFNNYIGYSKLENTQE